MAEEEGFEPPLDANPLLVFETSPFSLLGIPPAKIIITTHMQDYTRNEAKNKNIKNLIVPDDGQIINI